MRRTRWIVLAVAVLGCVIYACGSQDPQIVRVKDGEKVSEISLAEFVSINLNPSRSEVTVDAATIAALAANVYELEDAVDPSCDPSKPGRIPVPGWSRRTDPQLYPASCHQLLNGLHYEVWTNYTDGQELVAVVFRGTVPSNLVHWCSNLHDAKPPICDVESDQYLSIAPLVDDFLSRNYDFGNGSDSYVFAIGHSLGGGLAEMAAHSSYISRVFSIDGSPVTAQDVTSALQQWLEREKLSEPSDVNPSPLNRDCPYAGNEAREDPSNKDIRVYSIAEKGEFLSAVRSIYGLLGWTSPRFKEYRTNVLDGDPIAQHSIKGLACALNKARPPSSAANASRAD